MGSEIPTGRNTSSTPRPDLSQIGLASAGYQIKYRAYRSATEGIFSDTSASLRTDSNKQPYTTPIRETSKQLSVKLLQLRHHLSDALLTKSVDHIKGSISPFIPLMLVIHAKDQLRDRVAVRSAVRSDVSRFGTRTLEEELTRGTNNSREFFH